MPPLTRPTFRRIGLSLLLGLVSGCAHLYDPVDEAILSVRCCVSSKTAWYRHRRDYRDVLYPYHFGKGFRAGYQSVCHGSGGCPPTLPPREYWSACHQSEVGRAQSVEWFNGFAEGALVAQMDGRDRYSEIVTSREATGQSCQLETEYHINADQSTPYPSDDAGLLGPPYDGPPHDDWRGDVPPLGPPPAPSMTPDDFPPRVIAPGSSMNDGERWGFPEDDRGPTSAPAPLPLPPLDETQLPAPPPGPPIPDIDFHVETQPDGRPRGLVPTNFLSPEQEASEQLGSRINALWRKLD